MSDRLAEIERLREAAGIPTPMRVVSFQEDEYGSTWELHLEGDTSDVWGQDYATAYTAEIAVYLASLVNNADWLIARIRELEVQAAIGRLAQAYVSAVVSAVTAEQKAETLGLDDDELAAEWERRWDVADAAYERLRERVNAALANAENGE